MAGAVAEVHTIAVTAMMSIVMCVVLVVLAVVGLRLEAATAVEADLAIVEALVAPATLAPRLVSLFHIQAVVG